jgi:DNA adenine methylase
MKPLFGWVGGKRRLLPQIKTILPENYNNYIEPFIGAGALFFDLEQKGSIINDFNPELINFYKVLRDSPIELINEMKKHVNTEEHYLKIRKLDQNENFLSLSKIERAGRFLFLIRASFSSMWRVNSKGNHNVPYGKGRGGIVSEVNKEHFIKASELLKTTTILNGDYKKIMPFIKKGDFIFFDPPYAPLSATASFTSYTNSSFGGTQQQELKEFCDYVNKIGAYFMLSNSNSDFIKDLYKEYNINLLNINRMISAKAESRGKIKEVFVTNYKT